MEAITAASPSPEEIDEHDHAASSRSTAQGVRRLRQLGRAVPDVSFRGWADRVCGGPARASAEPFCPVADLRRPNPGNHPVVRCRHDALLVAAQQGGLPGAAGCVRAARRAGRESVSYTHLTLPT